MGWSRTHTWAHNCHTRNYDRFGTMQEGGEEHQAAFTADSDSGWDSFGSTEEAWRETARAPTTEANWKQEGEKPLTRQQHTLSETQRHTTEWVWNPDFSTSLYQTVMLQFLTCLSCFLFYQKSSKEKSWEAQKLGLERHIQKTAPYFVLPTESVNMLQGPVNVQF